MPGPRRPNIRLGPSDGYAYAVSTAWKQSIRTFVLCVTGGQGGAFGPETSGLSRLPNVYRTGSLGATFTTDVRESNVVGSVEHKPSHFVHSHLFVRAQ